MEFAFGEAVGEESRAVSEHLARCAACRAEVSDYKELVTLSRASLVAERSISPLVVGRISRQAAEAVSRSSWWQRLIPLQTTSLLAAAVPAMVAVLALGVGLAIRSGSPNESTPQTPSRLDMQVEAKGVRLAWTDGRGRAYKVYKTSDPRLLGRGQGTVVRGNQWVDQDPDSSTVVFYRVE